MKRAWIAALLLSPLACRGQFDIAQYLADGDTDSASGESGVADSPEADAEEAETNEADTDEGEAEADTSTQCEEGVELGDGCFGIREMIGTDLDPTDLALADFSGDARIDLLLAGAEFRVLLGNPDGGFEDTMSVSQVGGSGVAIGHVDNDGLIDFASIGDDMELHRSMPGGVFVYEATLPVMGLDAVFANIDGDEDEDLLVNGATLELLTVDDTNWSLGATLGSGGESLRAADIDGDGDLDIVLARPAGNVLDVFENSGVGSFASPVEVSVPEVVDVAVANLDGDEQDEVLALSTGNESVLVFNVTPSFELSQSSAHPVGEQPQRMVVAAIDDDGRLDVATVNLGSDDLSLLLGEEGGFATEVRVPLPSATDNPTRIDATDLDLDGRAELLVVALGHVYVVGYLE